MPEVEIFIDQLITSATILLASARTSDDEGQEQERKGER